MKKNTRIGLLVLVTLVLLLAMTIPGLARRSPSFFIDYAFNEVDWDNYSATGTFTLQTQEDMRSGDAALSWTPRLGVKKGTMIFTNGEDQDEGSFEIQFAIPVTHADGCGTGNFLIIGTTGEYADRIGNGTIEMCLDEENDILDGTLEGWAQTK